MGASFLELEKAIISLEQAIREPYSDIVRDASIQRFEFCIELSWKVTKKIMGTQSSAPKQVIREMAQANYIKDPGIWLQAIDQRNLTAHTYNETTAKEVYQFAKDFLPELQKLILKLK